MRYEFNTIILMNMTNPDKGTMMIVHKKTKQMISDYRRCMRGMKLATLVNPFTAGAAYIGFFTQLLPHSVPPFKHVKAIK